MVIKVRRGRRVDSEAMLLEERVAEEVELDNLEVEHYLVNQDKKKENTKNSQSKRR